MNVINDGLTQPALCFFFVCFQFFICTTSFLLNLLFCSLKSFFFFVLFKNLSNGFWWFNTSHLLRERDSDWVFWDRESTFYLFIAILPSCLLLSKKKKIWFDFIFVVSKLLLLCIEHFTLPIDTLKLLFYYYFMYFTFFLFFFKF